MLRFISMLFLSFAAAACAGSNQGSYKETGRECTAFANVGQKSFRLSFTRNERLYDASGESETVKVCGAHSSGAERSSTPKFLEDRDTCRLDLPEDGVYFMLEVDPSYVDATALIYAAEDSSPLGSVDLTCEAYVNFDAKAVAQIQ